jgi:biotin carboxyl carrier protein
MEWFRGQSVKKSFNVSGTTFSLPELKDVAKKWKVQSRPGGWWIAEELSPPHLRIRGMSTLVNGKQSVSVEGKLLIGDLISATSASGLGKATSKSDLTAQFPGKVRKVLVSLGQKVSEGESLILVEAMKMEFAVKAPFSGKISQIMVKEGQQLSPGDQMIDVEEANG